MSTITPGLHLDFFLLVQSAAATQQAAFEGLLWFGGLVLLFVLAAVILLYVRKRMLSERGEAKVPFDLLRLKELRDHGEITIQQYEALRQKTIDAVKADAPASESDERKFETD